MWSSPSPPPNAYISRLLRFGASNEISPQRLSMDHTNTRTVGAASRNQSQGLERQKRFRSRFVSPVVKVTSVTLEIEERKDED